MRRTFNEPEPISVPLRTFSSRRPVFNEDGRLHTVDMIVMAPTGPDAARILRERVAARAALYGPKGFDTHHRERVVRRRRRDAEVAE